MELFAFAAQNVVFRVTIVVTFPVQRHFLAGQNFLLQLKQRLRGVLTVKQKHLDVVVRRKLKLVGQMITSQSILNLAQKKRNYIHLISSLQLKNL